MSISIRIGEYGWTDNRYIVTAFGVWIVLSSVAYLVFRRDIRWIFGLFVVIASLSVLTPWINMFDVGIRSQEARLNAFFEEQGMISPEGKIMRFDEVQKIDYSFYSIVQYLHSRDALDGFLARLQEPFDTEGLERWELEDALVRALNIDAGYPRAGFRHLNIQQLRGS